MEGRVHMIKHVKGQKKALKRIKKVLNREIPDEELAGLASNIIFHRFSLFFIMEKQIKNMEYQKLEINDFQHLLSHIWKFKIKTRSGVNLKGSKTMSIVKNKNEQNMCHWPYLGITLRNDEGIPYPSLQPRQQKGT